MPGSKSDSHAAGRNGLARHAGPEGQLPPVMVIGGEDNSAVGIVRSFGRAGIPVFLGSKNGSAPSSYSRYVTHRFTYPADRDAACREIRQKIREWRPGVLLPVMGAWSLVYHDAERFADSVDVVPHPEPELRSLVANKGALSELARDHGMPVPETFAPDSLDTLRASRDSLSYPLLVKPAEGVGGNGIRLAQGPDDLVRALDGLETVPLVQEFIDGEDLELTILCDRGEPVAGSAYVMLRNRPVPYGPPCACRTIRDDELMHLGKAFLTSIGYHGVAHLDLRRDPRDGQPKLLDFNARLAGSNEISTQTGQDFGLGLYRMALGERLTPNFDYEVGIEFRWILFGEFLHLLETPLRGKALRALMRWRGVRTEVSLGDPMPHVFKLLNLGPSLAKRFLKH